MKRFLLTFVLALHIASVVVAQHLTASAPSQVAVGEQFRLTYSINTHNVSGFRAGNIPEALEVLMGPSTSKQQSFQMINGHTSSTSSITYTYILSANKTGTYTISPATATVDGKSVQSNVLKITVSGGSSNSGGAASGGRQQGTDHQMRAAGSAISGSDLFIRVSANKRRVHEQEPILLTYKVYTQVDLTQLEGKMPDLKGFHTQEVQLPQQKSFKVENINGRPYRTVTWSQYVMFPQVTGQLEIPSITFNGIVVQQNRDIDPFEAFFNGGSGYVEVKKSIKAPGITIQVDPLPARPSGFSGGVGSFNITAQLDKTKVKANDAVSLRLIVSGTGNLKLIKEPVVKFPKDFDRYDAKVTDKTKLTTNGVEGSMVYDFLSVPRYPGKYEIPAVDFVFYDTEQNRYRTVSTQPFTIEVEKGSGGSGSVVGQENLTQLNRDIRYIKTGECSLRPVDSFFFASRWYWALIVVLLSFFVSLFVVFRHRMVMSADESRQRGKKANKVAAKRLRAAHRLMQKGERGGFFDEVLRALWGYVGDKLAMPVEQLTRDNVSQRLLERLVDESVVKQFVEALDACEYARYAPGDADSNMNEVYDSAMTAIMQIEETMKNGKRGRHSGGVRLLFLLLLAAAPQLLLPSSAVTKAEADSAYMHERYQEAIAGYEKLLERGVNADVYYNLGNAYYRTGNITRAVLSYERGLLLRPNDQDLRFNLQMARSKTVDRITPESEMFFVTWYRSLMNLLSVDSWACLALISLGLAVVLALLYLFAVRLWLRKFGFFGAVLCLFVFAMSNLLAWQQQGLIVKRTGAIVIKSSVPVKSTPSRTGTDLFILHEGTRVTITDDSMRSWREIRIADGKKGWIEASQIEVI